MSLPQCTLCAGCLAPWRFLAGWRLGGPRARQWLTYVLCGHCVPCGVLGVSGIDGLFGEASSGCHFGPGVWWARREAAGWDVARGVGMGCHAMCMLGCGSWWETDGWWKWCWRSRCPGDRAGREDRPLPLPQPSPPPTPVTALPPVATRPRRFHTSADSSSTGVHWLCTENSRMRPQLSLTSNV